MNFKIVVDSGCDLPDELREKSNIEQVPLSIYIGDQEYTDEPGLDTKKLVKDMKASKKAPRTASPSPHAFMEKYQGEEENVFVVTLSSQLSSTYNNAEMAKNMVQDAGEKFIHIFDSLSASIGETLISMKIFELAKENYDKLQVVEKVNEYIDEMKTFFLLESLDNLIKAGRMNKVKGKLASMLNIKPVMGASDKGTIKLVEKVRGSKRAFRKLVEVIGKKGENLEDKVLGIAHCNCLEKAEKFKEEVLKRYNFKDIVIVEMQGIATVYANQDGLVIAF